MQDAGRGLGGLEAATAQRACHLLRLFRHLVIIFVAFNRSRQTVAI